MCILGLLKYQNAQNASIANWLSHRLGVTMALGLSWLLLQGSLTRLLPGKRILLPSQMGACPTHHAAPRRQVQPQVQVTPQLCRHKSRIEQSCQHESYVEHSCQHESRRAAVSGTTSLKLAVKSAELMTFPVTTIFRCTSSC